ncbi:hypothetical protein KJ951_03005 [Patescibacteria group bacterium]|nr:hypothetical protein [Patescibacteria group bacterium]
MNFFLPNRHVFKNPGPAANPEIAPKGPTEAPERKEQVDVKTYVEKYEDTKKFLEGVIDGSAIADMEPPEMTNEQKRQMQEDARGAQREMEGLPGPEQLNKLRDPKAWAGEYFPKIAKIMDKYFGEKVENTVRRSIKKDSIPDVVLQISGFHKRRTEAASVVWDIITDLQEKKFGMDHPFMKILLDANGKLAELGARGFVDRKSASQALDAVILNLPAQLEEIVATQERDRTKDLLATAAKTYRARLNLPSRAAEDEKDQERIREEYAKNDRSNAVASAAGRSLDKVLGRYGYEINGKWKDLPGNNPPDKDNPESLKRDVAEELSKIGAPDMSEAKVGEKWNFKKNGISFLVQRIDGGGEKPSYKVELAGIDEKTGKEFPRIAQYIEKNKPAKEKMA